MAKLIAYPLSVIFYLFFGLALVIFHPIQWICLNLFGYQAHKKSVDYLNFLLTHCLNLLGSTVNFKNPHKIPADKPYIIIANHQSMYDIPPIIWHMRKYHPKFISKIELGKGIPSVSYNLRHGGSVLIDRKNNKQALSEINKIAKYAEKNNRSVVIFPEGTRSKTGKMKKFQQGGLIVLFKKMPNAEVIPVSISNSWKTQRYGNFPMGVGAHIKFQVHEPIPVANHQPEELIAMAEDIISKHVTDNEQ